MNHKILNKLRICLRQYKYNYEKTRTELVMLLFKSALEKIKCLRKCNRTENTNEELYLYLINLLRTSIGNNNSSVIFQIFDKHLR